MATAAAPGSIDIVAGYRPGAIGAITALHGLFYGQVWGFDRRFEAEVAAELADFVRRFRDDRDGLWLALDGNRIVGSIAMDGGDGRRPGVRLRWFILDPAYQGLGLGRRLMQRAMAFAAERAYPAVYLMTFAGLDAARRLYDAHGFRLVAERKDADWNAGGVTHQTLVRTLGG